MIALVQSSIFRLATLVLCLLSLHNLGECKQILRDNFSKARSGDFLVTAQGSNFTVMHIRDKVGNNLVMEEITAPANRIPRNQFTWRQWIEAGAPGHTSWMIYDLDISSGNMKEAFSYTKNCWFNIPEADNFLSKLLNLDFSVIPIENRKRVGPTTRDASGNYLRGVWNPRMIVDGHEIKNVKFSAWKTLWPNDGSELAGKAIEVYIPEESDQYPSYFPYWLQISGMIGKAKVRVVDSGSGLMSPKPLLRSSVYPK
jgi:hypothetical protein